MNRKLVEVRNLKKYFPIRGGVFSKKIGDVKAVDDITFDIREGEIFGLVGESGCGKSTTGRTILNLCPPTAGSVVFAGQTIFDVAENTYINKAKMQKLRRNMQIIFQDPFASLDPRMSVGAIISEGLVKHKLATRREALERAKELLELCGIRYDNVMKYPHEFSGGQRQRISIARSLALNPQFIIGDEPIAALDVSIQAQVLTLLQDLKEKMNLTYLFISHDLGVIRYFCDRIAVMYLGSFVEVGTSEELFNNPLNPYTQVLLSAMPVADIRDRRKRIILQGDVPDPANPPSGCKFHTRCPYAQKRCSQDEPVEKRISETHQVRCHLVD